MSSAQKGLGFQQAGQRTGCHEVPGRLPRACVQPAEATPEEWGVRYLNAYAAQHSSSTCPEEQSVSHEPV